MLSDIMNRIRNAEENVLIARADAQTKAKNMIAEAEKKGQAEVAAAVLRAGEDARKLLIVVDQKSAAAASELQKIAAETQDEIRRRSESRLDAAAGIIVERIVDG